MICASALSVTACGSDGESGGNAGSNDAQTTTGPTSPDGTGAQNTAGNGGTTPDTFAAVTTEVRGVAVGGSSGGEGVQNTSSYSETVRETDGTCRGFSGIAGPGDPEGLQAGAPVVFLVHGTDQQIGTGTVVSTEWVDEDPGQSQWSCRFNFEGAIDGSLPESFDIKIADLDQWTVTPDASTPGEFVTSVNSDAGVPQVEECAAPQEFPIDEPWSVVGEYWYEGYQNMCLRGMVITNVERPCRPDGIGSDRITAVSSAADPNVVYEDINGQYVDTGELAPGTQVVVHVATGRPCG